MAKLSLKNRTFNQIFALVTTLMFLFGFIRHIIYYSQTEKLSNYVIPSLYIIGCLWYGLSTNKNTPNKKEKVYEDILDQEFMAKK